MGSEMCIRDRHGGAGSVGRGPPGRGAHRPGRVRQPARRLRPTACLLYTSDAADERSSVDLGGRRIINKKNHSENVRGDITRREIQKSHIGRERTDIER